MALGVDKVSMERGNFMIDADKQKDCGGLSLYNKNHHRYPEIEAQAAQFDADLRAQLGTAPTVAQVALAAAATAHFAAILLIKNRLFASLGRYSRIETLVSQLSNLTGTLQRTLRDLGMSADAGTDDTAGLTLQEYLAQKDGIKQ